MGVESKKGGEGKQEAGGAENKTVKNEKQKENKGKEEEVITQEIVLKVDMHCEACAKKVARSLRGFKGVEEVRVECKANKVVVKAAKGVDPLQLQVRVHKKSGRKVDILSPLLAENPKPESNDDSKSIAAEDPPKKDQAPLPPPPPPVTTVVLQVRMHCEACAQELRRRIRKISGVESVETDVANDRVTVKGVIENPDQLAQLIYKRTRKHASILKEEEDDKPKPAEPKGGDDQKDTEKKQGDDVSNKDGQSGQGEDLLDKFEHWPTKAYMEYYYANAPQLFSDENPNACTVM